jgi:arsenate reductase-like glutaredoxin family protein
MDYELAKQLKETGFPQTEDKYCKCGFLTMEQKDGVPVIYDCKTERISKPNLEELIEACGQRFRYLIRDDDDKWRCSGIQKELQGRYLTPDEAVARLWLALYGDATA